MESETQKVKVEIINNTEIGVEYGMRFKCPLCKVNLISVELSKPKVGKELRCTGCNNTFEICEVSEDGISQEAYRKEVLRTANIKPPTGEYNWGLLAAAMGMSGESGEFMDIIKKATFQGHPLDRDKLINELGDILWYTELAMHSINASRDEVEKANVAKLRKRYPEGFKEEHSIKRVDVSEQERKDVEAFL